MKRNKQPQQFSVNKGVWDQDGDRVFTFVPRQDEIIDQQETHGDTWTIAKVKGQHYLLQSNSSFAFPVRRGK